MKPSKSDNPAKLPTEKAVSYVDFPWDSNSYRVGFIEALRTSLQYKTVGE